MLSHPGAFTSIGLFNRFHLLPYMIEVPVNCVELAKEPEKILSLFERSFVLCETLHKFIATNEEFAFVETIKKYFGIADVRFLLYMSMIMEPFINYKFIINPKTQKTEPLVFNLMKESLKV